MSGGNGSTIPTVICIKSPDQAAHDALFETFATPPAKDAVVIHSCSNCMKDGSAAARMQKCSRCKMALYCSKECQREHWQKHKKNCRDVEGPGISRLVRKFQSNRLLVACLEVSLICQFDLLRNLDPDKPFMAHIDVGIEPSDISACFQLFAGAEFESELEGMLQLNALITCDLVAKPLSSSRMQMWRRFRESVNASGCSSDAVGLVEFANDSNLSATAPIHITQSALDAARDGDPFQFHSAFGNREVPLSAMSCLEYINTHIRSDSKNLLQLRIPMRKADKEIIRDAGRGEGRHAVEVFKLKIAREGTYRIMSPEE